MSDSLQLSPAVEGVAFSLPDPQALDPLFSALGVTDHGSTMLDGAALQRRFGLKEGRATVHHHRLGSERLDTITFEDCAAATSFQPGPANTLWFQHVAIVVSDMNRAAACLMPMVSPISESPQWLPNGVAAWKFRNAAGHAMELLWFLRVLMLNPSLVDTSSGEDLNQCKTIPNTVQILYKGLICPSTFVPYNRTFLIS